MTDIVTDRWINTDVLEYSKFQDKRRWWQEQIPIRRRRYLQN